MRCSKCAAMRFNVHASELLSGREVCANCGHERKVGPIPCLSCGKPAKVSHGGNCFCRECIKIHLVEKMFVNLTKLQKP